MASLFKKIISLKELSSVIKKINKKKLKIVLGGGCFDIFHYGHLVFLKKAKKEGDFLIILLESDEFIKRNKLRDPIHNLNQRAKILAELECVDLVIKLPLLIKDDDYQKIVEIIRPSVIAITKGDKKLKKKEELAKKVNARLKIVTNLLSEFSTSLIRKKLKLLN